MVVVILHLVLKEQLIWDLRNQFLSIVQMVLNRFRAFLVSFSEMNWALTKYFVGEIVCQDDFKNNLSVKGNWQVKA